MAGYPARVGRAPPAIVILQIEHVFQGRRNAHLVAAVRVDDRLRLARRPRRVQHVQRIFGIQNLRWAAPVRDRQRHQIVPPHIAPLLHRDIEARALDHDHVLHDRGPLDRLVGDVLQLHDLAVEERVVTCDGAFLHGKIVELKHIADEAIKRAPIVEHVVVVKRPGLAVPMEEGRDMWWHDLMSLPIADWRCPTEILDAEDPLYMLYTSGTTGKPKAIVHTHGGYQVGVATTLKYVFDLKDDDRWWCAADPGWVTGHSYIVYGPLILGATSFMYEGAPTYPYPDRWWAMVERYGINVLYTCL